MRSINELYASLTSLLSEILELDKNICGIVLTTKSGQLIDYVTSKGFLDKSNISSFEELAATIAAMFGATVATGEDFNLGDSQTILAEFANGRIVIVPCGAESILAIITSKDIALGNIRLIAKKYARRISEIISQLFKNVEQEIKVFAQNHPNIISEII